MLTVHGITHPGRIRKINEDGFYYDVQLGLYLVADGLGGHNAGEIASRLALESVLGFIQRTREDEEFTWPFGVETGLSYDANRIRTALRLANRRVFQMSESGPQYGGMGTTVVAALVSGDTLTFASVGDSRMYLVNDHTIAQLTEDDSWLSALKAQEPNIDACAAGAASAAARDHQGDRHADRHRDHDPRTAAPSRRHPAALHGRTPRPGSAKPGCSRSWTPTRRSRRARRR